MPQLHYAQIRYLSIVVLAWLTVFALTRSLLLVSHLADANISISNLMGLYAIGMIYDLSFLLYATLPMALYLLLCPRAIWQQ
ncbi:LTA synthase family protein, partial [Stutzerimonas stutzeri]